MEKQDDEKKEDEVRDGDEEDEEDEDEVESKNEDRTKRGKREIWFWLSRDLVPHLAAKLLAVPGLLASLAHARASEICNVGACETVDCYK